MHILVVDDDVHIRKLVRLYLRDSGAEVSEAGTGEEALAATGREVFDIVVVDLILPYFGGFRLSQKLKAGARPPRVVIITGDESPETRSAAAEAGADAFVVKPFTKEELLAAVLVLQ